jgi:hypothetical protein
LSRQIAPDQRFHRAIDRRLCPAAHFGDVAAQHADLVVECLDRVFAAQIHYPYLPVI